MEKYEKAGLREAMVQALIEAVEDKVNLAVLVSDSTSTSKIAPFQEKYPERLVNVGIAEQNMVGVAAGLALGGYVAVTANAAPFLVARANEQVKNDVCYSETNVKLVGLNAGVCYGNLGSTHHAIDDISVMRGLGNILILAPSDAIDTKQIVRFALNYDGPVYIRMDSDKLPIIHREGYQFYPGKVDVLQEGDDVTIVSVGSVTWEAVAAAEELKSAGINADVLNISSIRPLDKSRIIESLRKTRKVVTVEEHSLHGGISSLVAEIIADEGLDAACTRLGITEGQFSKAGPRAEIRAHYNIDKNGIVDAVKKIVDH